MKLYSLLFVSILCAITNADTLKSAASSWGGYIGTEMNANNMKSDTPYKNKAAQQYNMAVAEYECKMSSIQWAKGKFAGTDCDYIKDWALGNGMKFRFHALVWGIYNPSWLQNGERHTGAANLRSIMKSHIEYTVQKYASSSYCFDVVNEAIKDSLSSTCYGCDVYKRYADQAGTTVEVRWYEINDAGGDYVKESFQYAHAASPSAKLFYNDYSIIDKNNWMSKKAEAVYQMVKGFKADGVPIHGIGFQTHISATDDSITYEGIKANFDRFAALGVEIHVTEIDVENPANNNAKLAAKYDLVLRACMAVSACKAFVSWGYTDKYTWKGSSNNPLPFDDDLSAKTAVSTMISRLKGDSSSSGSSGSSGSGPKLIIWENAQKYWVGINVVSDQYITSVSVQGSNWGSVWSTCEWNDWGANVWSCNRKNSLVFTSLPLNVKITKQGGGVSSSYGVITSLNEGGTFYAASFGSSLTEEEATDNKSSFPVAGIIVIVLISLIIIGVGGYCLFKKYKNDKFDRKDEDKMIPAETPTEVEMEADSGKDTTPNMETNDEIEINVEEVTDYTNQ